MPSRRRCRPRQGPPSRPAGWYGAALQKQGVTEVDTGARVPDGHLPAAQALDELPFGTRPSKGQVSLAGKNGTRDEQCTDGHRSRD
jgi:hypothetical protein